MAIVIHTRKGKYQYAYEHTREGDKVISRYMYPVDAEGVQTKPYQREVAQQKNQYVVIKEYKKNIQNKSIEHLAFIDKDGKIVVSAKGSKKHVSISLSELAQIPKGCVSIHNHLDNVSFSKDDIKAAYLTQVKETIIVTPTKYKTEYKLSKVDKSNFNISNSEKILSEYDIAHKKITSELWERLKKGEITVEEANKLNPHLTMIELVRKNKQLKYEVIKK